MSLLPFTILSALAFADALCLDGSSSCSSVTAQDSIMLQMNLKAGVQRPVDPSMRPQRATDQGQFRPPPAPGNMSLGAKLVEMSAGSSEAASRCSDLDGACAYYKSQGYCSNSDHIRKHCQRTCGVCPSACNDLDGACAYYKSQGYCASSDHIRRHCMKTCDACAGSGGSSPAPSGGGPTIKVVSYNLFWWNAFDQNPGKSDRIVANIKSMQADTIGLQECNDPGTIMSRTGNMYGVVSPFRDNQGVMVKPGLFTVEAQGSRDLQARGKWGARYVTWAKLRHAPSGRAFFHFNTHWCVHSGNGYTCDSGVRHTAAKNMLRTIRDVAGASSPVLITGDFNAGMGERGPQELLRNGFGLAKNSGVDAIFYSKGHWSVVRASEGDAANSDHRPVIVDFQLAR